MKRHHENDYGGDNPSIKRQKLNLDDKSIVSPSDITELVEAILAHLVTRKPMAIINIYSVCKR
jgi:hypothetical protein